MKDNKLIAEFMGMTTSEIDESMMIFKTPQGNDVIYLDELKYHESWDWLMPVLKKINEQISPNVRGLWRKITNPYEFSIEDVYKQAVEVINRLNNNE